MFCIFKKVALVEGKSACIYYGMINVASVPLAETHDYSLLIIPYFLVSEDDARILL